MKFSIFIIYSVVNLFGTYTYVFGPWTCDAPYWWKRLKTGVLSSLSHQNLIFSILSVAYEWILLSVHVVVWFLLRVLWVCVWDRIAEFINVNSRSFSNLLLLIRYDAWQVGSISSNDSIHCTKEMRVVAVKHQYVSASSPYIICHHLIVWADRSQTYTVGIPTAV